MSCTLQVGAGLVDSGRCIAFKPDDDTVYLVGTEEGELHLATTQYSSQYLASYPAHITPVYSLQWNPHHQEVFLSCAAEFVLKIWHREVTKAPVWRLDLGGQAGAAAWAPYSATVLAAVTRDGRVTVWDLSVSRYAPLCVQVGSRVVM